MHMVEVDGFNTFLVVPNTFLVVLNSVTVDLHAGNAELDTRQLTYVLGDQVLLLRDCSPCASRCSLPYVI